MYIIMCNFHVYNWENANIKDLNSWRILMKFLCIYIGDGGGGGACTNTWEHT